MISIAVFPLEMYQGIHIYDFSIQSLPVNEVLHLHPGCTPRIFKFSSTVCFELVFQVLYFTSARLKTQAALEVAQMQAVKDLQSILGSAFGNNRINCEGSGLI